MIKIKRTILVFLAIVLILPSFLVGAQSDKSKVEKETLQEDGEIIAKDEVVYAKLSATGIQQEIYVVNIVDIAKPGRIIDYGSYSDLKNLTNLSEMKQTNDHVQFAAEEGKFYYQGNNNQLSLPWTISISYLLDGKEIEPSELAGIDGHVEIRIHTSANEEAHPVFFENYLLQISLLLDSTSFTNIDVSEGILVNVGKNKQVTYTVMPNQEAELRLNSDVVDFHLQGIEIAALPSVMSIDTPDIGEMTEEMTTLADAIKEINEGVGELKNGVTQLNEGVISLENGSDSFKNGMNSVKQASSELINGSSSIDTALTTITSRLQENSMDFTDLAELPKGLSQLAKGLNETTVGLSMLRENYTTIFETLEAAMNGIPEYDINEQDIQGLYASGADPTIINQLVETYTAARKAKGTYSMIKEGFLAVDSNLKEINIVLIDIGTTLTHIATDLSSSLSDLDGLNSIRELQEGLTVLSTNYQHFHAGLVNYTDGVTELASAYHDLHSGIEELSKGTADFRGGVGELHDGTEKLNEATSDLPDQMQEEIDAMLADYTTSDFDVISFVSASNEKINHVQFVIKTESIEKMKEEIVVEKQEEVKGFWNRLVALFSK